LKAYIARQGVLASIQARTRLVTHLNLSRASIDRALQVFREYPGWGSG